MSIRDLIPWSQNNGNQAPSLVRDTERDPFLSLHREVNRLFDDVFRGFGSSVPLPSAASASAFASSWPRVEIFDGETEIRVSAEVPGLDEKDIEVLLADGALTLRGEKRSEAQNRDSRFSERFYGRFERRIPLGYEVEDEKVDARFRNGVLTVTLPKSEREQSQFKRIAINA